MKEETLLGYQARLLKTEEEEVLLRSNEEQKKGLKKRIAKKVNIEWIQQLHKGTIKRLWRITNQRNCKISNTNTGACLLYTSDAADE